MASAPIHGMTRAAPTARCGHTEPNSQTESCRSSRMTRGRELISAHSAPYVPCWPTRASSWNQISIWVPAVVLSKASFSKELKFF